MKSLKERIEELMVTMTWSVPDIARVGAISKSAVYQWLGHGSKEIHGISRIDVAERLAAASGYNALWLARGEGPKFHDRQSGKTHQRDWPFPSAPESQIRKLAERDLTVLDAILAAALKTMSHQRPNARSVTNEILAASGLSETPTKKKPETTK